MDKKKLDHDSSTLIFQQLYLVPNRAFDGATKGWRQRLMDMLPVDPIQSHGLL